MDAGRAKRTASRWVEENAHRWVGLCAAHLVGGITAMPDDTPFPAYKDVDIHLVFDDGSPSLSADGPFPNIIEVSYGGILIEAGVKPVAQYRSPEAALANPEIAYHLTVDSSLYDPSGLLDGLRESVRREYSRRRWVLARLEHERNGLEGALGMLPVVSARLGATGEYLMLGYSATYLAAALGIAALQPPRMGGRMLVHMRSVLAEYDRLDLYEEVLDLFGVRNAGPERVGQLLGEAAAAFDLAVRVRRTPHPFQHKLHAHLRPYFVESCRSMIAEGYNREALTWAAAFYCASTDVILVDGPEEEKPRFAGRQAGLLRELGVYTAEEREAKVAQARRLHERVLTLAGEIAAGNPRIAD